MVGSGGGQWNQDVWNTPGAQLRHGDHPRPRHYQVGHRVGIAHWVQKIEDPDLCRLVAPELFIRTASGHPDQVCPTGTASIQPPRHRLVYGEGALASAGDQHHPSGAVQAELISGAYFLLQRWRSDRIADIEDFGCGAKS